METTEILERASFESWTDQEIVDRVKAGDTALYEIIMRRYNQRILRGDAESEDVMQDAYVRAYQDLDQFEGRAPFPTGLTRIAVHEALTRVRTRKRNPQLNDSEEDGELLMNPVEPLPRPEDNAPERRSASFWKKL
jgi:RNA polymerase sigma-70 factor, ECF subfamily